MSLYFHKMSKRFAYTALLTLTTAGLITGCKKDTREKIDLSTIHTTAASETMVPETELTISNSSTEASTATTAPAETTAAPTKKPGNTAAVKNLSTKLNTYTNGSVSIQYPSVTNMEDTKKAAAIDALMKSNALSVLDAYELDGTKDRVAITCKVLSVDRNRITITYTGTLTKAGAAYPANLFYSNTIDVNKEDNIGFQKFVDPYTMAGYVLSGDCTFYNVSPELTAELMKIKNDTTIEQYTQWFTSADFPYTDSFPQSFSYEHEATIFFTIPVPHALGDYAIVAYTPDTK